MPDSAFLIDIIKNLGGLSGSWMFRGECGRRPKSQRHVWDSRTLFLLPRLRGRVELWLDLGRFVGESEKQTHTNSPAGRGVALGWKRRWMLPIKQEWMDARMDGWQAGMNGEEEVAPSPVYLFCMHTLPSKIFVMQILPKNLSYASWVVHCVCVCVWVFVGVCGWGDICVRSVHSFHFNLPLLIVDLENLCPPPYIKHV